MNLKITHNAGFFSCCAIALHEIMTFFNEHHCLPDSVDRSGQFLFYKDGKDEDITSYFFRENNIPITYEKPVRIVNNLWDAQHTTFIEEEYLSSYLFIDKYFNPSGDVMQDMHGVIKKYSLYLPDLCTVHYRGTDRRRAAPTATYADFIHKALEIKEENPGIEFLLLTDETEFKDVFMSRFPGAVFFEELGSHPDTQDEFSAHIPMGEKLTFAQYFLAAVLIAAQSKILITHSGNCSVWEMLYRGNNENVHQFQIDKWL